MNHIIANATLDRRIPDWRAVRLAARVPMAVLRQARDISTNTSDELYFQMLESVGIDAICDMVSQGCFIYDVAITLDIPVNKFREWIEGNIQYIEKVEMAEEISAEAYLSMSNDIVMSVGDSNTDEARVAKIKAEHLRWLASVKDRQRYGKHVSHKHTGSQTIEYRISLAAPAQQNIIDVPTPAS